MRRFALLTVALVEACLAAAASRVSIRVSNPTEREFRISYEQNAITGQRRIFRVQLRDDNTAAFELDLADHTELQMAYGGVRIPLYIGPDDKLAIALDAEHVLSSISFAGPAAADHEFLAAYAKTFPEGPREERGGGFLPFSIERSVLAEAAPGDVVSFARYVNDRLAAKRGFLAGYRGQISDELRERYYERARYSAETQKIAFLIQNQRLLAAADLRAAAQKLEIAGLPLQAEGDLLGNDEFKNYLRAYAQYLALPNSGAHDEATGDLVFAAIRQNVGKPWRHYLESELLVNAFDYLGHPSFGLERYPELARDEVPEVYRRRIEDVYGGALQLQPDALAPNIGMYTTEDLPMSLTDLSGRVVYLSFWASWCKPCLENFKQYDPIRAQLEEMGVVLLNIDIDEDEAAWKSALAQLTPRGINVRATKIDELKRVYSLASIPAYYIIDKHGRFVVLPEGQNRDLIAAFEEISKR